MKKNTKLIPEIQELADKYFYDYICEKTTSFLKKGNEEYRKSDFYDMPQEDWPDEIIKKLKEGCQQILEYIGLTPDTAFRNLEVDGFYRLMELFHYEFVRQAIHRTENKYFIDKMEMKHVQTNQTIVLYNTVKR
ncbi:MAG: hypothetical protein P9L97_07675 [Candidatus Tenebribacter davisii]|nr:hypothetical protein [Candidatus Tenebribacter davisii]